MSQCFDLYFGNHLNHIRNHLFSLSNIELEGFVILLTFFIVFGSTAPLRFTFIVLGDSQVLVCIFLVSLQNDLSILIHNLVRKCNDECFFSFAAEN
jgi:hypothetical protein